MKMVVDDENIELEILDTGGSEEFKKEEHFSNKLKEREGFIVVFDLSDKSSFKSIDSILQ
jgi:GTPase SAR1 family protein